MENIPGQEGRVAIVTGANSGLGYHTSMALAIKGARVIMACRNLEKGEEARQNILLVNPCVEPEVWELDLSDLGSVKAFTERVRRTTSRIDILINNAGLMATPYAKTRDGFELQFGVNHLGHFALTAQLWFLLKQTRGSRIVNVSSEAHHFGKMRFEDIHWEKNYSKWGAYGMSKLSNLLFTDELSRQLSKDHSMVTVSSAHPGYSSTKLQAKGYLMAGKWLKAVSFRLANWLVAQSAEMGSLPTLFAATAEGVEQGSYFGPSGFMRLRGWPAPERPNPRKVTREAAERLWLISEKLTGLKFEVP